MSAINLNKFRPMKSASPEQDFDFSTLKYPLLASPKLDGIRCVIHPTLGAVTNTLKPIPNNHIRKLLSRSPFNYLDGELIVGNIADPKSFKGTQSGVMTMDGEPDFTYQVFDNFEAGHMCGFSIRTIDAQNALERADVPYTKYLPQVFISDYAQLQEYEEQQLAIGYEGVIIRSLQGKYKFGRSTLKEGDMVKMKRFTDAEAIIINWDSLARNENEAFVDNLGLQKRGYSQKNKVVDPTRVGRFYCQGINGQFKDALFWIGSGLTDDERLEYQSILLTNPERIIGQTITYKYQAHGSDQAPRTPIWKGFRKDI